MQGGTTMKSWIGIGLLWAITCIAQADGINERNHPDPGTQAKINRIIAQTYAMKQPPVDHAAVFRGVHSQHGRGVSVGLSVGNMLPSRTGAPRSQCRYSRQHCHLHALPLSFQQG
jgi:hypothetical protein